MTGAVRAAQIFVAALGASNYTFVDATWTQKIPDWIASHVRMVEYFGGVTALLVPDDLGSGVTYASYYAPELNATYTDFAMHYHRTPACARSRRSPSSGPRCCSSVRCWRRRTHFAVGKLRPQLVTE